MGTFLINSGNSGKSEYIGFLAIGDKPGVSQILDLETFTHLAPILLTEHEPEIVRLYEVLMARLHLRTVSIADKQAALNYMLNKPVSLVISDLNVCDSSSLELLKALRQDKTTCDIPFIVVTATPEPETRAAFKALGGNAYLTKPILNQQFTGIVTQLLTSQLITEPSEHAS